MSDEEKVENEEQDVEAHSADVLGSPDVLGHSTDALGSPDVLGHSTDALGNVDVMRGEEGDDVEAHKRKHLKTEEQDDEGADVEAHKRKHL